MKEILVVGSIALDSVKTPAGESREALGGSAVYFSLAASLFSRVHMVGVVGRDFPQEARRMLESKGIGLDGLEVASGKTFRWSGSYARDFNSAKTLATHLNVFADFRPRLSESQKDASVVFLANIDPELQWEVLSQMTGPRIVACDTMNYWIQSKLPMLKELLSRVDVFFVNEEEARQLTGEANNYRAARKLLEWGPSVVVLKKGEHGAILMADGKPFAFPAYPVEDVSDPTGAGDTFAGGFLGCLTSGDGLCEGARPLGDVAALKRAMIYGSVLAAHNVRGFGTKTLESVDLPAVQERYRHFVDLLSVREDALVA